MEDEVLLALVLELALSCEGAEIVGPCYTIKEAQNLATKAELTAAVLDVELGHDMVAPVARTLSERGVPFIFCSSGVNLTENQRFEIARLCGV